jgi:hypothetical protein
MEIKGSPNLCIMLSMPEQIPQVPIVSLLPLRQEPPPAATL